MEAVKVGEATTRVAIDRATAQEIAERVWGGIDLGAPAELSYVYEHGYRPLEPVQRPE